MMDLAGALRNVLLPADQFAEWKPYTNPKTKQQGAKSAGGRIVYGDLAQKVLKSKPDETKPPPALTTEPPAKDTSTADVPSFEMANDGDIYSINIRGRGNMYAVRDAVNGNARGTGESLHATVEEAQEFRRRMYQEREAQRRFQEERKKREAAQAAIEQERSDMDGFMDDATALARGKAVASLSKMVSNKGRAISIRDLVREKIRDGWIPSDDALHGPDGVYLSQSQIGSTAIKYARHLVSKKETTSKFAEQRETALAGPDGARVQLLLASSEQRGRAVLEHLTARAVKRLLTHPRPLLVTNLFDDQEYQALADAIAATRATASLLGAVRVRERADTLDQPDAQPFQMFDEDPQPLRPVAAVDYFRRLVPELGTTPERVEQQAYRKAFTLAEATDQGMLEKVKAAILDKLESGTLDRRAGPNAVADILDAVGVTPKNPQYAEMVFRTNVQDAYNAGQHAEMQTPDMREEFPVWLYMGIRDGRQGADHEPRFDKYYSSALSFAEVRGPRVWNCRCSFAPIHKRQWDTLRLRGTQVDDDSV